MRLLEKASPRDKFIPLVFRGSREMIAVAVASEELLRA